MRDNADKKWYSGFNCKTNWLWKKKERGKIINKIVNYSLVIICNQTSAYVGKGTKYKIIW